MLFTLLKVLPKLQKGKPSVLSQRITVFMWWKYCGKIKKVPETSIQTYLDTPKGNWKEN